MYNQTSDLAVTTEERNDTDFAGCDALGSFVLQSQEAVCGGLNAYILLLYTSRFLCLHLLILESVMLSSQCLTS